VVDHQRLDGGTQVALVHAGFAAGPAMDTIHERGGMTAGRA
jgi:hypothetical protein